MLAALQEQQAEHLRRFYRPQTNLRSIHPDAAEYARDERAAGLAWLIQYWVTRAERLINGPEAERVDHRGVRERVANIAPPMPTRDLFPWLREKASASVKGMDIRNWARRGKIHAVETAPQPTHRPHEVLPAWRQTQKEGALRLTASHVTQVCQSGLTVVPKTS